MIFDERFMKMFSFLIRLQLLVGLFIQTIFLYTQDVGASGCSPGDTVPNLVKRSRNNKADGIRGSDPYVDDSSLWPGWYSAKASNGQYLMPDINTIPEYKFCGTIHPIYLKKQHPNIENMTDDESETVTACEFYPFDNCLNERTIAIKKCGDEVQYYLVQSSSDAAFCFDPPEIQGKTDFTDPPTVSLGSLSVFPELVFTEMEQNGVPYLKPSLEFTCTENGGENHQDNTIFYTTYWYIDHELVFVFDNEVSISKLSENDLMSKGYSLGIYMRCGVKIASSIVGLKSDLTISNDFFAGIEVSDKVITMDRRESYTVTFTPTVPLGCYRLVGDDEQSGKCIQKVHMIVSEEDRCVMSDTNTGGINPVTYHDAMHALCGFEVQGCRAPDDSEGVVPCEVSIQHYSMTLTTQSFGNDYTHFYRFRLETQGSGTHDIWKNYMVGEVDINIQDDIDVRNKICYSHVDPHMQTTKGQKYENNDAEGEFILYWNIVYDIQVQERTTLCDHFGQAFCTCAVAVRAGGDIFLINLCNDLKFIGMTSCKDNALVIQKYSELEYHVQTNIGTLIKIRIRPYEERLGLIFDELMNIDIVMAPKDYESIRGLCGLFDTHHDFHDRDGNPISDDDRTKFIEEWKLRDTDTSYLLTSCNVDVMNWEQENQRLFCYCDCYDNECDDVESEAICSPSQYLNCSVNNEVTTTLCNEFADKCTAEKRKRKSSFTFDPEEEMQRKAKLSYQKKMNREKREIKFTISNENATTMCTERILGSVSVKKYSDLFGGYNYSSFVQECILDVFNTQNDMWISAQETAAKDAVQIGFKINSNFTLTNYNRLIDFKIQYCPSNCSGNGYCNTDGVCICNSGYFGPACGNDKIEAPRIDDVEGGGLCDIRYGSECRCFEFQTRDLAKEFYCKRVHKKVFRNGNVQELDTDVFSGAFKNMFMGECCFDTRRQRRSPESIDDIIYYLYDVSISNDGDNFGDTSTVYKYDSTCLNTIPDGDDITFELKNYMCIINGICYGNNDVNIDNYCLKCNSATDQFNWTYSCADSDNEKRKDRDTTKIAVSVTVSVVAAMVVLAGFGYLVVKKIKQPLCTVSSMPQFTDTVVEENTDAVVYNDVTNTMCHDNRLKHCQSNFKEGT